MPITLEYNKLRLVLEHIGAPPGCCH